MKVTETFILQLGPDGLPVPAKMNTTLLMIMAKQNSTLIPAFNQCTLMYQTELANITGMYVWFWKLQNGCHESLFTFSRKLFLNAFGQDVTILKSFLTSLALLLWTPLCFLQ
jgi:hypothetical protein